MILKGLRGIVLIFVCRILEFLFSLSYVFLFGFLGNEMFLVASQ